LHQYFRYIIGVSFIGGRNPSVRRKPPMMPQVTDKLDHIILYKEHLVMSRIQIRVFGSRKSKDRYTMAKMKRDKRINNDLQNTMQKKQQLKIEQYEPQEKPGMNSCVTEG
jgi:hypothetical protein